MAEVWVESAEIYQGEDGQWRWRTLGANGEVLGFGEGYVNKADAVAVLMAHVGDEVDIEEVDA